MSLILTTALLFYAVPLAALVFFVVSLVRFIIAKNKYKRFPESFDERNLSKLRMLLIISSVIIGVLLAIVIGFAALLTMAVAYM